MESRIFPHDMELNVVNLLNFTLSQLNSRKRVMWFIHFCQNVACLQEAQRQISVQTAMIDQKMRSIQHRLLWSDNRSSLHLMERLRSWMRERRFYRELTYAVLKSISTLFRPEGHNLYPEGIRRIEEWHGFTFLTGDNSYTFYGTGGTTGVDSTRRPLHRSCHQRWWSVGLLSETTLPCSLWDSFGILWILWRVDVERNRSSPLSRRWNLYLLICLLRLNDFTWKQW